MHSNVPSSAQVAVAPSQMRHVNRRALLSRLRRMGLASRADLGKSLGMSQPTVGKIVDQYLELQILEEVAPDELNRQGGGRPVRIGRPGRMLRLNRTRPRFLGIQLGVTGTDLAALPIGIEGEDHWTVHFQTPDQAVPWVERLNEIHSQIPGGEFWAVLVSVPGIVNEEEGRVLFSPNLHWTEGVDLPGLLAEIWDAPVLLVQEERALALGHQYVEPESENFLLVDFGDGVGGAIVMGGEPFPNPLPISGELGHNRVVGNQRKCGCGAIGCLETLCSRRGLLESWIQHSPGEEPTWGRFRKIILEEGVPPWLVRTLESASVQIAGALNVLGLRRVVLTGSLIELPDPVPGLLTEGIQGAALWARFGQIDVVCSHRRRAAGLVAVGVDRFVLPISVSGQDPG